jgi:hypothetical protein
VTLHEQQHDATCNKGTNKKAQNEKERSDLLQIHLFLLVALLLLLLLF